MPSVTIEVDDLFFILPMDAAFETIWCEVAIQLHDVHGIGHVPVPSEFLCSSKGGARPRGAAFQNCIIISD